jgi:uncharacterized protein YutE (UPF0331/DUF86 family)
MEILKSLIAELDRRLELWEKQQKISFAEFQNIERQDAIMHNMLIAIQIAIDLGNEVIKAKKLGLPSTYKDVFRILAEKKLIAKDLASELERLAGFRNALIHLYLDIDVREAYRMLKQKLKPLKQFYKFVKGLKI